ncbi:group II intron reverse transcriptase/maturase [Conexibacter sp. S30A1]|uniref:group II intron reverse transcriptase/maturase n=1 Tax=Conexibacter sp. S30A1 TaxID=2937800 RepID=UPI0035307F17
MTHDREQSDGLIVPVKLSNNARDGAAEAVEGSGPVKGNAAGKTRPGHCAGHDAPSALDRVRRIARQDKDVRFTALLHHVDVDRLRAAYFALRPKAAPGVDGVTWDDYGQDLEGSLTDLHARVHRGAYRARPSRRVFIPKPDGRLRPLGVAALEDKILQRAVVEVLNAVYEQDFLGFSYGFRPGRSPHDALDALAYGINRRRVNWVLDADFSDYFSRLDHQWLVKFLEHRIADERVLRLIQKWLAAGVIEAGSWTALPDGVPQGASASPLLANVYAHYVLDLWADQWRRRHAHGHVVIVRFADDFVVGFEHRQDAERFWVELRERLAKFGLELNAEKTRLIEFGRFAARDRAARGLGKPETFQFLGFTHMCGKARKTGQFKLLRTTDSKRMRVKLHALKREMAWRMHQPIPAQGQWLATVLQGHYNYYAVPNNSEALHVFREQIIRYWRHSLRRRSQRNRIDWTRMNVLADRWLPAPRILHPWPEQRFAARTQDRSPVR